MSRDYVGRLKPEFGICPECEHCQREEEMHEEAMRAEQEADERAKAEEQAWEAEQAERDQEERLKEFGPNNP